MKNLINAVAAYGLVSSLLFINVEAVLRRSSPCKETMVTTDESTEKTRISSAGAIRKRKLIGENNEDGGLILLDYLQSEVCSSYMKTMEKSLVDLAQEFDDETITSFLCNPIELSKMTQIKEEVEEAVTALKDDDVLTCEIAHAIYMTEYTDSIMILDNSKSNLEVCVKEVKDELVVLHNQLKDKGSHRELYTYGRLPDAQIMYYMWLGEKYNIWYM